MVTCHTLRQFAKLCIQFKAIRWNVWIKLWMYHIEKIIIKHQRRSVTVVNCDWHSTRTPGSVQEPGARPGAREESASPFWPATSVKNSHIYIYNFFSYRVTYVITLSYYVKIFESIPNSRQFSPWLLEKIIWNCVLSRTARLYTVITHNVPGKAICVPILWFDSLYLNNLHLSKHACKVAQNNVARYATY